MTVPATTRLVDDHETVRRGLKLLIDREPDLEVTEEASDGHEAVATSRLDDLDVVVMDLSMPGVSGIETTRQLRQRRGSVDPSIVSACGTGGQAASLTASTT